MYIYLERERERTTMNLLLQVSCFFHDLQDKIYAIKAMRPFLHVSCCE